jgi:hypothetical protein
MRSAAVDGPTQLGELLAALPLVAAELSGELPWL